MLPPSSRTPSKRLKPRSPVLSLRLFSSSAKLCFPKRNTLFYYRGTDVYALRYGDFKAHFITEGEYGEFGPKEVHKTPILYNLSEDPAESLNIAEDHPHILEEIDSIVRLHKEKLVIAPDQLEARE